MHPSPTPRRPSVISTVVSCVVVSAWVLLFGLGSEFARLDGMRIGRTTAMLASAIEPVKKIPVASWSAAESERVRAAFGAAMVEAGDSVEALEWVEVFASRVNLPAQAAAAKAVRCPLEQRESVGLGLPRKFNRATFSLPARASAC